MSNDFFKNNKFTQEQSVAVKNDYGNVLVSASAGSGKTKVLVGRILNLILEKKCKIKDLLVVTFTNAAADEMKARLKQELIKYNLLEELDDLNNADIFNLHKFCSKIIKEFFFVENLDSSFSVFSENEADYLLADCVEKSIIQNINDIEFQNLLESYNKNRNYLEFKKTVFKIYKFLRALEDSTSFTHTVLENSFTLNNENKALNFLNEYYVKNIADCINELKTLRLSALAQNFEKIHEACLNVINIGEKFLNKTFLENFETLKLQFEYPVLRGKTLSEEEKELRQKFSLIKKELQQNIESFSKCCAFENLDELQIALNENKQRVLQLLDFISVVNSKYSQIKEKLNSLDFNDLEQYTLKILANVNVLNTIKNRYKYIFVDEYQDTNSLQEKLLGLISSGDNLFMVGDVKQSIYGFRFCNPQIFIDKYKMYENSLSDINFLINLNKNFRSKKQILDFCNFIFSRIMTTETCGINYLQSSMFTSGKAVDNFKEDSPLISISVFPEEKQESEAASGLYNLKLHNNEIEENSLDKQIYFIAEKIKDLLKEDIFDEDLNGYRKVRFSDIAILSRNRSKTIERISSLFKQMSIPVNASFKAKLFESESVNLLLNYLRLLENFYQDIPLYSVLNSFIYNLTEDDLSLIKLSNNKGVKYFYENVLNIYNNSNNLQSLTIQPILNKLSEFFKDVNYFTNLKSKINLVEIVNNLVKKLEIENYYVINENYTESQNLNLFCEFVKGSGFDSVSELLFYIDNFGADKTFDKTITDSENSVCLTTIHASKGLEYPIVFMCDMGKNFSNATMHESFVMDIDLGISTNFVDIDERFQKDVPTTKGIKFKKKQFELQEEMRLLYVALTRAKNKLYLVGEYNLEKISELGSYCDIVSRKSYYDWILGLLSENQKEALIRNGNLIINYDNSKFEFNIVENFYLFNSEKQEQDINIDVNTKIIKNYLNFEAPQTSEKLRYTVSEILENEEDENFVVSQILNLNEKGDDIDFSRLGTIYHEIMQKLEFENLSFMECKKDIPKVLAMYEAELTDLKLTEQQIEAAVYNLGEFLHKEDKVYKEIGFHLYESAKNLGLSSSQNKVAVQGVVDLIIERNDEIIILDYKTSRFKNEQDFIKKYKKQLDLYALAVSKFFKKRVSKKIIYSFYLNRLIFL